MKRLTTAAVVCAITVSGGGAVYAKGKSVTGIWALKVEHAGLKLTLRQEKDTVNGTLEWPHGDPFKLTGRFAGETLTFSGDSGGDNFTIHIDSAGMLQRDGTLTGVFKAHFVDFNDAHEIVRQRDQEIPWTAARAQAGKKPST